MNDDSDIESLLGKLAPSPPPEALMERLRAAHPRPRQDKRKIFLYLFAPLAAAAGLAFALLMPEAPAPTPPVADAAPSPKLLGSLQHLMEVADLGIVQGEDQPPVRLIRTRWIDEILYASPDGGPPVKEGRLREEVLPVSLPIY